MKDEHTGISLRFIRQYDASKDLAANQPSLSELIWQLAANDERDVPFMQKLFDARDYIKSTRFDSQK